MVLVCSSIRTSAGRCLCVSYKSPSNRPSDSSRPGVTKTAWGQGRAGWDGCDVDSVGSATNGDEGDVSVVPLRVVLVEGGGAASRFSAQARWRAGRLKFSRIYGGQAKRPKILRCDPMVGTGRSLGPVVMSMSTTGSWSAWIGRTAAQDVT